jgi:hypothetical protein
MRHGKQQWLDNNPDECLSVRGNTSWKIKIRVFYSQLQGEHGFFDMIIQTPNS